MRPANPFRVVLCQAGLFVVCGLALTSYGAEPQSFETLGRQYSGTVRPLLKQFCLECHSTVQQEGELDLERFSALQDVREDTKVWMQVAEMLASGEMPPRDAEAQPTAAERREIRDWIRRYFYAEARANAGDPGPVVLRRLSNAEYTYTIRDLTGVALDPAKEFPADSAAGEGFTNTGQALVMSPALLAKYFDAGKAIAQHAVLLPDGFRFSPLTTRSDWSNDALTRIRALYERHAAAGGGAQVNLQGIVFDTNEGGLLPLEQYLAATLAERNALESGTTSIAAVAQQRGLNPKYLRILWETLTSKQPSLLLDSIRATWRDAGPDEAAQVAAAIGEWQQVLWRFASVGHIGKVGGPKAWQEPVTPLETSHEFRWKLPSNSEQDEVVFYLVAGNAGDGDAHDHVIWQQPRLVAPGRADLFLRDVRPVARQLATRRTELFAVTARALAAAAEAQGSDDVNIPALAEAHAMDATLLRAWLEFLGVASPPPLELDYFKQPLTSAGNYEFVKGWGMPDLPSLFANSSDQHVRIPGNMKPHGVCVHPTPSLFAAIGWKSPLSGPVRIEGKVTHAHPECGNGVTWAVELRRGTTRQQLATGTAHGANSAAIGPIEPLSVQPGDLVSLLIGPRGEHSCDLTDVEFVITETGSEPENKEAAPRRWSLTEDVSPNVLAGNPHADRLGNPAVWHFYAESVQARETLGTLPVGSLLARWQSSSDAAERQELASALERLLNEGPAANVPADHPDTVLYRQMRAFDGPLLRSFWPSTNVEVADASPQNLSDEELAIGVDPTLFGKRADGQTIDSADLAVQAPSAIEVRLPAELVANAEFVTTAKLDPATGSEGSVQVEILPMKPADLAGLMPTPVAQSKVNAPWTSNSRRTTYAAPILVAENSTARQRLETAFEAFRQVFPIALCYTKIVPVDEVVTLTLYYREDEALQRLMLDEKEIAELNRLWDELHFVSHDAVRLVDAFQQLLEYASQDADPKVFEPMRGPIEARAEAFRAALVAAEPKHVEGLVDFAARAYRRPLTSAEEADLRQLYQRLRQQELSHEQAFRLTLARIFIAPAFLYRIEQAGQGGAAEVDASREQSAGTIASHPVTDWELASRLSYFLWSSQPDDELRAAAAAGTLHEPDEIVRQTRRMLQHPRMRRLATEFACQWLQIYELDALDEKSERHFPEFATLRGDMYEEAILFFTDMFQNDASLLSLLNADHTFVNERLASFYALPPELKRSPSSSLSGAADGWQRVDGVRQHGRGGILGLAATLAKQSGASRTSPILRGTWISEVLLGEKLPDPPKDVPLLPEESQNTGLTVRELVEKHSIDERCASCHRRIDPFGFALEHYDAIGRRRERDIAGLVIDTSTTLPDGTPVEGADDLRDYLRNQRRDVVMRQFCRKLLGFALGRGVQLSDEPLLDLMQVELARNDYRVAVAIELIVTSRQFREIRSVAMNPPSTPSTSSR